MAKDYKQWLAAEVVTESKIVLHQDSRSNEFSNCFVGDISDAQQGAQSPRQCRKEVRNLTSLIDGPR